MFTPAALPLYHFPSSSGVPGDAGWRDGKAITPQIESGAAHFVIKGTQVSRTELRAPGFNVNGIVRCFWKIRLDLSAPTWIG